MTQNRKETAWKKNRKFGDIHGGRMRLKCTDGIFKRKHSLLPPSLVQETPIFIQAIDFANNFAVIWGNNVNQTIEGNLESRTDTN